MTRAMGAAVMIMATAGVILVVAGLIPRVSSPPRSHRRGLAPLQRSLTRFLSNRLVVVGVAAGFVCYLWTTWPLMLVVVPLGVVIVPRLLAKPDNDDIALLEALDRWVRLIKASVMTGKSVADAVRATRGQVPAVLQRHVNLVLDRLSARWTLRDALLSMADELGSADADAILAALILAADRGGTGASAAMTALSDNTFDQLKAWRDIEAERAKPRIVVRQVTMITAVVIGGSLLLGGSFFAPYGTPIGQLLLAGLMFAYLGSLVWLRRLTIPRRRARILISGQFGAV